jgi:ferredoxin, 2Fe-2S
MAEILIENLNNLKIQVPAATRSLLSVLQENYIDWMHACGGKGKCTTCKAVILAGSENTGPITSEEQRYLHSGGLKAGERLACQLMVHGDITIRVPHESKLPHIRYSDDPQS